jgi:tetratricopeptide (TPR) repeat protein
LQPQKDLQYASRGISLRSHTRAIVFMLAILVPGIVLAFKTVVIAVAATLGTSSNPALVAKATALDPSDPDLHYRLGMAYSFSFDHPQPQEGLRELREAVQLDPSQPAYWSALASACESLGDEKCAANATRRTLELAPMTPRYWWDAANRSMAAGASEAALGEFRRLIELDPEYAPETFRLCLAMVPDAQKVYHEILAGRNDVQLNFAYIDYLSGHGQGDQAFPVFQATLALDRPFPFSLAESYLNWLLAHGDDQQAAGAWQELESHRIISRPPGDSPGNLIFNSGFEQPPLNAGFDWRIHQEPYTRVSLDELDPYQGRRSLRVDFTVGQNEASQPVSEVVPVQPSHTYRLEAYVRSDSITSDSGPRLRVTDPQCASCLDVSTDGTTGTTDWHPVGVNFTVGPTTRVVLVSISRPRSMTFPTDITGTFWVDNVSLSAASVPPTGESLPQTRHSS